MSSSPLELLVQRTPRPPLRGYATKTGGTRPPPRPYRLLRPWSESPIIRIGFVDAKKFSSENYFRSENLPLNSEKWSTIRKVVNQFSLFRSECSQLNQYLHCWIFSVMRLGCSETNEDSQMDLERSDVLSKYLPTQHLQMCLFSCVNQKSKLSIDSFFRGGGGE